MGFRLRMPAEIGAWLAGLAGTEPEAAAEVGASLLALMDAASLPGYPLIADPDAPEPREQDEREALDRAYQDLLADMQRIRRGVADVSTRRRQVADSLRSADLEPAVRAGLERQLAQTRQREEELAWRASLVQHQIDLFRTQKETAKAVITATEARLRIEEALGIVGLELDGEEEDLPGGEAAATLEEVRAQADTLLASLDGDEDARSAGRPLRRHPEVRELHADPLGSGARILLTAEPPGTITVLAVLADADAVSEHREMALDLADELLAEIRADGWPAESPQFEDGAAFLARFFPGRGADLAGRAAAFGHSIALADLRERAGLTVPELARRARLDESTVRIIEFRGAAHPDVQAVAAYVRGLGGTLRLTIGIDGDEHRIG